MHNEVVVAWEVLDALDMSLHDKYVPEVFGLRQKLLDKSMVAMVLVLCDVLRPVVNFSDYLQGTNTFSDMQQRCGELVDQLHHLALRFDTAIDANRPDSDMYLSRITNLFDLIDDRNSLGRRLRGPQLTERQTVETIAKPVVYALINEISDAFQCSPVLSAFSVFNIQKVPESMREIVTYGDKEIGVLASHYGQPREDIFLRHRVVAEPVYSEAEIKVEFQGFKHQMCLAKQKGSTDIAAILSEDPVLARSYKAMAYLVDLSCIVPTSTACVERLFSLMNSLCTPSRSSLGQVRLESLIRIVISETTELSQSDINNIINIFNQSKRDI
ncbi:hypothetical protein MAR_018247, partial [Mya arenaria]